MLESDRIGAISEEIARTPAESKAPGDHYELVAAVPAEQAFRPVEQGGWPMVGP